MTPPGSGGFAEAGEAAAALLDGYDTVLVDLDGVLYLADEPVPGAAAAIESVRRSGRTIVFVTNNAARSAAAVAERLGDVGVAAQAGEVVTSAAAAAALLAARLPASARTLVIGTAALADEVRAVGLRPVASADDAPLAVVSGYFPDLRYADLAEAALAIRAGALWVSTNLDATIPTPRGLLPGNGSVAALLERATGVSPIAAGKPAAALFETAVAQAGAARALMVGDRLDTDIAGAKAAGLGTLLVLSGVATLGDVLTAAPAERPDAVGSDVSAVLAEYAAVRRADRGRWQCAGWAAVIDGDAVRLTGSGSFENAVRAAVHAAWAALDDNGVRVARVAGLPDPPALDGARTRRAGGSVPGARPDPPERTLP